MVLPRFVGSALKNEPIVVHGDGQQTRCFAHVLDVVEGLANALDKPDCFGQVINLGSDSEVTINELARRTVDLTASKSDIRHVPYDQAYGEGFEDMRRRVPSLEKAKRLLGYRPTRQLETIIRDVADDLCSRHSD
jgi:UDP-glucose 4-epimerase